MFPTAHDAITPPQHLQTLPVRGRPADRPCLVHIQADVRGGAMAPLPPPPSPGPQAAGIPFVDWAVRAREAGHPVAVVEPGRYHPEPMPSWSKTMPPNDLLDAAKEYARARVTWVHVVMPDLPSMLALSTAILGPRPTGPARMGGSPASVPWHELVDQQRIAPRAISETRDGVTTHVVDVPVSWLGCPIVRVGPSLQLATDSGTDSGTAA